MSYDLYCQKCGEPYDFFHVQDEMTKKERVDFRAGTGCPACKWGEDVPEKRPFRSDIMSMLTDILGDDVDGIASEMDYAELLFGENFWEE